jgi:hypothetical protein
MKIISRFKLRRLRRSLCTLLIGISALWAMPRSAQAQSVLLVSQSGQNAVNEYDANTGALIKTGFITGIISPSGMLLSGSTLYVASGEVNGGFINTYNASTGTLITANLISNTGLFGQINGAAGLGLVGNTLYVANSFADTISTYDATSGASIATPLIYGGGASPELRGPDGLVISGNNFFVSNNDSSGGWVGEYNLSGATINDHFISTPGIPAYGLAISGTHLFVATGADGGASVEEYDVNTGALLNPSFISGLQYGYGLAVAGTTLYVSQNYGSPNGTSVVSTYDVNTGALLNPSFVIGLNGGDNFMLVVTPQAPPIANAGTGRTVQAGTLVTLDGSASSDPSDQLPLTYAWSIVSQPAGGTAVLSNPAIVNPTFTPNVLGNYVIQLVVTDTANLSSAPASVTISTTDAPPVANAGTSQTITATGTLVHLNGTQSYDLAGLALTYQWSFLSKPAGSNAVLSGPSTATPIFTADVVGDYSVQLVVTDSLGTASSPSTVLVSFNDVAPIANAGSNQSAMVGGTVTLNGSKSTDTDGEPLTYKWSLVSAPSGSKAAISNPTAQSASIVPDLPGTFVVQLIVNDGFLNSLPATAEIAVVSQQTSLIAQIQERQGVIATLPNDGFRFTGARAIMAIELNGLLLSVEAHDYVAALVVIDVLLAQSNGCATIGRPDANDLITNCPDQSEFYPALLNIAAEIKALVPPPAPTPKKG